ncbi:MAG: class I tRNA ligase family protein, partial [Patescibacteria group bacterium]
MFDFRKVEQETLSFWKDNNIFRKSLNTRKKHFVFFEGPPTANGRPGIHHFLGRAFKDLFCRYKTMRGFYVLRKAGWDTHGLPVELEVEKELGFKSKKDIEKYGIAEFNKKAKESVWKYKTEWEEMTKRIGFWLDMSHPYITYENKYIESLWAIIKKIWDKKLLYLAHRVVPFCTRCGTSLSSHEVAQGYRTVTDKSVTVKFKIQNSKFKNIEGSIFILAWTTTPWTLPGNVALAVGKDVDYAVVEYNGENLILAKDLVEKVF